MGEASRLLVSNSPHHGLLHARECISRRAFLLLRHNIRANAHNRKQDSSSNKSLELLEKSIKLSSSSASAPPILKTQQSEKQYGVGFPLQSGKTQQVSGQNGTMKKQESHESMMPATLVTIFRKTSRMILRFLSSFRLAVGELLVIAALCALGTLIEQGQSEEFYMRRYSEELAFGILNGEWVLRLCLDHVYTSPYFLGLLALLAASLMACTSTRQLPLVKIARRWRFNTSSTSICKLGIHETLRRARLDDFGALLVAANYQVFVKGPALYAFKGLAGRFAPIGVHAALLLIMGGATYSAIGGYHGSIIVPQGLNFMVGEVMYPNGMLAQPPDTFDTEVHVNKFSIETYPNGQVFQFHSDLSLYNLEGREVSRKVLSVNDPLRYGGFTMYQTDWAISVFQVHVDGEGPFNLVAAPLRKGDNKLFGTFLPLGDKGVTEAKGISLLARDLQSVLIYDTKGAFVGVRKCGSGRPITVDGVTLVIDDVIGSTGLELKLDPGVPMVYAGFGALMLTTVISYLSHVQVWALQEGDLLVVGGRSNRHKTDFAEELDQLLNLVPEVVKVKKPTLDPSGLAASNSSPKDEAAIF